MPLVTRMLLKAITVAVANEQDVPRRRTCGVFAAIYAAGYPDAAESSRIRVLEWVQFRN
jgi:hypothetical protein